MEVRLLGPVEVYAAGRLLDIGGRRPRSVLAALAVNAGEPVQTETIVDRVWGQAPPDRARHAVQVYITRLRGAIERAGHADGTPVRLARRSGGYLLDIDQDRVDMHRFRSLVEQARDAQCTDLKRVALLREALDLWHGPPLADLTGEWVAGVRETWQGQRLDAVVRWAEAELRLGNPGTVVGLVTDLLGEYPLVESLAAVQIRALHAAGRTADALSCYTRIRRQLVEELGVEPGPELQELHREILRGHPPSNPATSDPRVRHVPAQLPLDVHGFTGRAAELEQLDAIVAADRDQPTAVLISAVSGSAGVGKTALAVHWAHRAAAQFPDGQLYVDLRGYTVGSAPLAPDEALGRFLRALGVPDDQLPRDVEERAGLYRSLLDGRRMLVVLDNAATSEQVRPLLPGHGASVAVATSRDDLRGLVALHGARPLSLDTLRPEESRALLERVIGAERVRAEPDAADAVASLCAHLPLALRIAAANLLARPQASLAEHATELRGGDRLATLSVSDDSKGAVRVAFDLSYATLPAPARRLFRLLGLVPGPDITPPAAAALADLPAAATRELLAQLARAHLVAQPVPGRFTFHDLLRRYAAERAAAEDAETERSAALARLLRFYLRTVDAVARQLYPQLVRLPYPETEPAQPVEPAEARAWLDAERPNLVAAVLTGARRERDVAELAWLLADALRGYFWLCRGFNDWLAVAHAADDAATVANNLRARAAAQLSLGVARLYMDDYEGAVTHNAAALDLGEKAGWPEARAAALSNLGSIHMFHGEATKAVDLYLRAAQAHGEAGSLAGRAIQLSNLGQAEIGLGRLRQAVAHLDEALSLHQKVSSPSSELYTQMALGNAYHALGQLDRAADFLIACLALSRQVGHRHAEVLALRFLAGVRCDQGNLAEATRLARSGLAVLEQYPDRRLISVVHNVLGAVEAHRSRFDQAADHYETALKTTTDDREMTVESLIPLAGVRICMGRTGEARSLGARALRLAAEGGYRLYEGQALTVLASAFLDEHDPATATSLAIRALEIHRETGHQPGEARTELLLGCAMRARDGNADAARAHWRWAITLFRNTGIPREVHHLRRQWPLHSHRGPAPEDSLR